MPTIHDLIAREEANLTQLRAERAATPEAAILRGISADVHARDNHSDPSDREERRILAAQAVLGPLDARIRMSDARLGMLRTEQLEDDRIDQLQREVHPGAQMPHRSQDRTYGGATIGMEARTYSREAANTDDRGRGLSFFSDLYHSSNGDPGAQERIRRHMAETQVEAARAQRAGSTSSFGGLVPPAYLLEQAALVARAARPFANSITRMPLPEQGMTIDIPRGTTGASAAVQAAQNTTVSNTDEIWSDIIIPVITIAGQQDVSRQSLERGYPGLDALIFADLAGAYATALDQQVLSGTGAAGQMLGVFNTAGVGYASPYAAPVTVGTFYSKLAGQISGITSSRFLAPDSVALHPRRAAWLEAQVDSQGRPLVVPGAAGAMAMNPMGTGPSDSYGPGGTIIGLNAVTDANVPVAVGASPEDIAIVYRSLDLMLWENGDGMPQQLRFEQTLGNQLTVKLVAYGYAAFTAARYPAAVGIVGGNSTTGNGQVAPTF